MLAIRSKVCSKSSRLLNEESVCARDRVGSPGMNGEYPSASGSPDNLLLRLVLDDEDDSMGDGRTGRLLGIGDEEVEDIFGRGIVESLGHVSGSNELKLGSRVSLVFDRM